VIALAGNGEFNDMGRGVMAPLVVQVLDRNGLPVEGATVVFRFPVKGPSAVFFNQQTSQAVRTNADGQAAAVGWKANGEAGTFDVKATATRGNEFGEVSITMTNVASITQELKPKHNPWWKNKWIYIIGAGAGGGIAAGIRLRDDSSTITISPGSPTLGGPR
jgi:hypothetical protein